MVLADRQAAFSPHEDRLQASQIDRLLSQRQDGWALYLLVSMLDTSTKWIDPCWHAAL